jgi:hypothetical protein
MFHAWASEFLKTEGFVGSLCEENRKISHTHEKKGKCKNDAKELITKDCKFKTKILHQFL